MTCYRDIQLHCCCCCSLVVGFDIDHDALETASDNVHDMEIDNVGLVHCDLGV